MIFGSGIILFTTLQGKATIDLSSRRHHQNTRPEKETR
jgi:hypothetical protein